jgi:hypothetical protein
VGKINVLKINVKFLKGVIVLEMIIILKVQHPLKINKYKMAIIQTTYTIT